MEIILQDKRFEFLSDLKKNNKNKTEWRKSWNLLKKITVLAIVASLFATAGMACEDVIETDSNYTAILDVENDR